MLKRLFNSSAPPSLIRRLIFASALLLPLLLFFSAFMLHKAYVDSLNSAEKDGLEALIYALIAVAESSENNIELPELMTNPRFEQPASGLYARVINFSGDTIWQSNSLDAAPYTFAIETPEKPGRLQDGIASLKPLPEVTLPKQLSRHRSIRLATIWETTDGEGTYTFEVIHSQAAKNKEVQAYRRALLLWLGGMALLLLCIQFLVARWGLKPLVSLAKEIDKIEQGESNALSNNYPVEIRPVTGSVNKLLISERQQRTRFQNALADLAHSLKTPLSVIRSQLDTSKLTTKDSIVDEQIERMTAIISHQLTRANAEVKAVFGIKTELGRCAKRIISALEKVYKDKHIRFNVDIKSETFCAMEENDLMEVLGNILENACKYGHSNIHVQALRIKDDVRIDIEDDGNGIPDVLKNSILKRGARADTTAKGQGIGLSVAVSILSSYGGSLKVDRSALGGAIFSIQVSAA